jgi:hypothetical protein
MKTLLPVLLPVLLIAAVLGYFVDLRHGDVAGFVVRVAISAAVACAIALWRGRGASVDRDT